MLRIIHVLVAISGLSCAALQPYQMQTVSVPGQYSIYAQQGTAIITGQAFLKTRGGDVKYAAGNTIFLIPITPHTEEYVSVAVIQRRVPVSGYQAPPQNAIRKVIGDGEGRFQFTTIPAGEYYILTDITWEVPSRTGSTRTGGTAYARVSVADGQSVTNIVNKVTSYESLHYLSAYDS